MSSSQSPTPLEMFAVPLASVEGLCDLPTEQNLVPDDRTSAGAAGKLGQVYPSYGQGAKARLVSNLRMLKRLNPSEYETTLALLKSDRARLKMILKMDEERGSLLPPAAAAATTLAGIDRGRAAAGTPAGEETFEIDQVHQQQQQQQRPFFNLMKNASSPPQPRAIFVVPNASDMAAFQRSTESLERRRARFKRTAHILSKSGMLDVTLRTADLLRRNQAIQKEIAQFKQEVATFMQDVLQNPENAGLRKTVVVPDG